MSGKIIVPLIFYNAVDPFHLSIVLFENDAQEIQNLLNLPFTQFNLSIKIYLSLMNSQTDRLRNSRRKEIT